MKDGYGLSINKIGLNLNRTTINGKFSLLMIPNGSSIQADSFQHNLGDSSVDTIGYDALELTQARVWHFFYLPTTAESISLFFTNSRQAIIHPELPFQEITINAIMLYTEPAKYI